MSCENRDLEFIEYARQELDETVSHLDAELQSRLTRARYKALEQKPSSLRWFPGWMLNPAGGLVAVACLMLAVTLTLKHNPVAQKGTVLEDLEILATNDQLELYEELDFYAWLAEEESAELHENG